MYFQNHIIVVKNDGKIYKVTNLGVATVIWNTAIAAALVPPAAAWSTGLTIVDITDMRGELIVTNGVDKPLLIKSDLTVKYLQDIPSGSNVFTPITKFVTTVSNYVVMAGFGTSDEVFVSATGAGGTWVGDPAPNDAMSFRVGAYTGQSGKLITAIASFRKFLLIFFIDSLVVFELGTITAGVHSAKFVDVFSSLGTFNHKTLMTTDSDLIFFNRTGVWSAQKNVFGGTLESSVITDNLGVDYSKATANVATTDLDSFIGNDPLSKTLFIFIAQATGLAKIFAATYRKDFSRFAWAKITDWDFDNVVTTEANRVIFFKNDKAWQYGNAVFANENYTADYITTISLGVDINFDWELPWTDTNNKAMTKKLVLVLLDTLGTSTFFMSCFVDGFYKLVDGTTYDPALMIEFVAGETGGYGTPSEGYGGGRRANDERFFGMPVKFKIIKLRFSGATKKPLRISSITMVYVKGNYKR